MFLGLGKHVVLGWKNINDQTYTADQTIYVKEFKEYRHHGVPTEGPLYITEDYSIEEFKGGSHDTERRQWKCRKFPGLEVA